MNTMTSPLRMFLLRGPGEAWRRVESHLEGRGTALPLPHRNAWAEETGKELRMAVALDHGGPRAALAFEVRRPRSLPGHECWHIHKFGSQGDPLSLLRLVGWLRDRASEGRCVVSLNVEAFALDDGELSRSEALLQALRFRRSDDAEAYTRTRILDVSKSDDALLSDMSSMGRRNVRKVRRSKVRLAPLREPSELRKMVSLLVETRRRTGGPVPTSRVESLFRVAARQPDLVRVVGMYDARDELVAFATGLFHGNHVSYGDGASTRESTAGLPLAYGLIWDLVAWARERGVTRLDLGGVPSTGSSDTEHLPGIGRFKRQLGGTEQEVGSAWRHIASPWRARFLDVIHSATGGFFGG